MSKAIIISAPSGAGKTTIVKALLAEIPGLEFSVSACTRTMRPGEINGKDYYFFTTDEFRQRIERDEFVEWQEVYSGSYYGTLKSEMQRIWDHRHTVIFEVDAIGGINLKKYFGAQALSISYVLHPSKRLNIVCGTGKPTTRPALKSGWEKRARNSLLPGNSTRLSSTTTSGRPFKERPRLWSPS